MPTFVYYATFDESISFLKELCAQGNRIIAELGPSEQPASPSFDSVTPELVAILKKAPNYFLAGPFTRFPVQYTHLKNGAAAGKYVIDFLSEGPLMQSIVGRVNVVNGAPKLLPGDVSYQRRYLNPETGVWAEPSPAVKAAFKKAVSAIKKRCERLKEGSGSYIAPAARKLLASGEARI